MVRLLIKPIYGWGWYEADQQVFQIPSPFELDIDVLDDAAPFAQYVVKSRLKVTHFTVCGFT
jgi:hypothetical protein